MTVYLVGAGPGDAALLTLRGAALLARADLVVHDRLVDPAVLALASEKALLIDVGKRPGGAEMAQDEINALLANKGRDGVVVRLKGGDPYVFGRGGEEARALEVAGVAYEVVPGVSAALSAPALAGVPLTLRGASSAVVVLTGHDPAAPGLDELARSGATLVAMMAAATRGALAERLMAAGMAPSTPVVAVHDASLSSQRSTRTTLGDLASVDVAPPATLVIGAVAGERLYSAEDRPLFGKTVVLTREHADSGPLGELLAAAGARVVSFPTISIGPPEDGGAALAEAATRIGAFEWVVLASAHAVEGLFSVLRDARDLGHVLVAVVGAETARVLASHGVLADLVPERPGAAGLLEVFPPPRASGKVLLPRAAAGGEAIAEGLDVLGYATTAVTAYVTRRPAADPARLSDVEHADAIVFASPSAVDGFLALAGAALLPAQVVAIGPTTSAHLRSLAVASRPAAAPSPGAVLEAVIGVLGPSGPGDGDAERS